MKWKKANRPPKFYWQEADKKFSCKHSIKRERCLGGRVEPWAQRDNSSCQAMSGKGLWFSFESCNVIHILYTSNIDLQWRQEDSFTECSSLFRQYCKCISVWFFYQSYEVGIHMPLLETYNLWFGETKKLAHDHRAGVGQAAFRVGTTWLHFLLLLWWVRVT